MNPRSGTTSSGTTVVSASCLSDVTTAQKSGASQSTASTASAVISPARASGVYRRMSVPSGARDRRARDLDALDGGAVDVVVVGGGITGVGVALDVASRGLDDSDPVCVEALGMFCAMLGTVAGNLALTLGARGGVYIAGGIVPRLGGFFARSAFRERFVEKGRLRDYLGPIPTYVVTHELPAFLGLKAVLDQG